MAAAPRLSNVDRLTTIRPVAPDLTGRGGSARNLSRRPAVEGNPLATHFRDAFGGEDEYAGVLRLVRNPFDNLASRFHNACNSMRHHDCPGGVATRDLFLRSWARGRVRLGHPRDEGEDGTLRGKDGRGDAAAQRLK